MTDKIEETIKEIAATHGIAVGRDDPILILHTINDRLMKETSAAQQAQLEQFKSELEDTAHRWGENAQEKAERTLTAALKASKGAMNAAAEENARKAAELITQRVEDCIAMQVKQATSSIRWASFMNLAAAFVVVLAAGLVVWSA